MKLYESYNDFLSLLDAAEQGDKRAHTSLAYAQVSGYSKNYVVEQQVQSILSEADAGSLSAAVKKAICLEYGVVCPRDLEQSYEILTRIVQAGKQPAKEEDARTKAAYLLGLFLFTARRGSPSKTAREAVMYLSMAAEGKHATAQCRLAFALQTGLGVAKNLSTAVYWYKESVRNGGSEACFRLADIYSLSKIGAGCDYANLGKAFQGYQLAICRGETLSIERKLVSLESKAVKKVETEKGRLCVFEDGTQAVLNTKHPAIRALFKLEP